MELPAQPFLLISLVLAITTLAVLLGLSSQLRQLRQQLGTLQNERQLLESRIQQLEKKIEFLNTGAKGIGQRLMTAEKKLNQSLEKQDELLANNSGQLFQRQAERVLKQVAPADDEDSLSRSEAKLMALVGNKPKDNS